MIYYVGKVRKEIGREKSSALGGNGTHDLTITRGVFHHCSTPQSFYPRGNLIGSGRKIKLHQM